MWKASWRVLILVLALGLVFAGTAEAGRRAEIRKNRIHGYRYKTCATCPRVKTSYVTYDAKNVIHAQRKEPATAYNGGGSDLFTVWLKAETWFAHGHFTRPINWSSGINYNDGFWNHWDEVPGSASIDTGHGAGPPEYGFRRSNRDLHACWPVVGCVLSSHPYVQITARASKREPFRVGHSHG